MRYVAAARAMVVIKTTVLVVRWMSTGLGKGVDGEGVETGSISSLVRVRGHACGATICQMGNSTLFVGMLSYSTRICGATFVSSCVIVLWWSSVVVFQRELCHPSPVLPWQPHGACCARAQQAFAIPSHNIAM